jgi:type III pantothenate kinase
MLDLVTIDCGNSTIDCLRHRDGSRMRFAGDSSQADDAALAQWLRMVAPARLVAATVVPSLRARLGALAVRCQLPLAWAGSDLPCPLPLAYDTPATLGADRWLGALAAHRVAGRAIVVDCGTATTVNLVDLDGTFRGGPIGPGLRAIVAGMAAVTPGLPAADLDGDVAMPPRSSAAAVAAGVLRGYCGLVERLVADAFAASRGPAALFVTGGNAARLLRHSRLRPQHEPALVHRGLAILAGAASVG